MIVQTDRQTDRQEDDNQPDRQTDNKDSQRVKNSTCPKASMSKQSAGSLPPLALPNPVVRAPDPAGCLFKGIRIIYITMLYL